MKDEDVDSLVYVISWMFWLPYLTAILFIKKIETQILWAYGIIAYVFLSIIASFLIVKIWRFVQTNLNL